MRGKSAQAPYDQVRNVFPPAGRSVRCLRSAGREALPRPWIPLFDTRSSSHERPSLSLHPIRLASLQRPCLAPRLKLHGGLAAKPQSMTEARSRPGRTRAARLYSEVLFMESLNRNCGQCRCGRVIPFVESAGIRTDDRNAASRKSIAKRPIGGAVRSAQIDSIGRAHGARQHRQDGSGCRRPFPTLLRSRPGIVGAGCGKPDRPDMGTPALRQRLSRSQIRDAPPPVARHRRRANRRAATGKRCAHAAAAARRSNHRNGSPGCAACRRARPVRA